MNSNPDLLNLDYLAAKHSQSIINTLKENKGDASETENLITKSLGVLSEDGIFAAFVYLLSRKEKEQKISQAGINELLGMVKDVYGLEPGSRESQKVLDFIAENITADLDKMMLCKTLFERILTFARYGAKAWDAELKASEQKNQTHIPKPGIQEHPTL